MRAVAHDSVQQPAAGSPQPNPIEDPSAQWQLIAALLHVGSVVVVEVLVVEVEVVVSQALAVPQISPAGQSPQLSMSGQLPSLMRPHWSAAHVVGVQHVPNGLLPGGALLTHSPLCPFVPQQL